MTPEKVAELTTQIVVAAMQSDKFDAGNSSFVTTYYDAVATQILKSSQETGEKA